MRSSAYVREGDRWVSAAGHPNQNRSYPRLEIEPIHPDDRKFDYNIAGNRTTQLLGTLHTSATNQQQFVSNNKPDLFARSEIQTAHHQQRHRERQRQVPSYGLRDWNDFGGVQIQGTRPPVVVKCDDATKRIDQIITERDQQIQKLNHEWTLRLQTVAQERDESKLRIDQLLKEREDVRRQEQKEQKEQKQNKERDNEKEFELQLQQTKNELADKTTRLQRVENQRSECLGTLHGLEKANTKLRDDAKDMKSTIAKLQTETKQLQDRNSVLSRANETLRTEIMEMKRKSDETKLANDIKENAFNECQKCKTIVQHLESEQKKTLQQNIDLLRRNKDLEDERKQREQRFQKGLFQCMQEKDELDKQNAADRKAIQECNRRLLVCERPEEKRVVVQERRERESGARNNANGAIRTILATLVALGTGVALLGDSSNVVTPVSSVALDNPDFLPYPLPIQMNAAEAAMPTIDSLVSSLFTGEEAREPYRTGGFMSLPPEDRSRVAEMYVQNLVDRITPAFPIF